MKSLLSFDPRTQLLMVLLSSLAAFAARLEDLPWIMGFMAVYLAVQGTFAGVLQWLSAAGLLYLLQIGIIRTNVGVIQVFSFMTMLALRLIPVFMASQALMKTPSGKLLAALQRLRLPQGLLVAVAVSSRFMPVLRLEYEAVQVSARLRGVSFRSPRNWLRPLAAFEYTMVPLLMRSLKISDQLAASAATKGIDAPGPKTSIYPIAFGWQDVAVLLAYTAWLLVIRQRGGMI